MYITEKIDNYLREGTVCKQIINEANNPFNISVIQNIKSELSQGKTTVTEVTAAIKSLPAQRQQMFRGAFFDYFAKTGDTDAKLTELYGMFR